MTGLSVETELALLKATSERQQKEIEELRKRQGEVDKMKHGARAIFWLFGVIGPVAGACYAVWDKVLRS
ncbi:MAG: hypothetical protein ACU0A2_15340 [Cognatishimia sp.]|uniref:hypothetical protein n=1 Tax=Cognatishimia sp. TaxID=2211648 RepID=UPI0040580F25